jgi:hypothetical protein
VLRSFTSKFDSIIGELLFDLMTEDFCNFGLFYFEIIRNGNLALFLLM